ncbi:MAG: antiterminator LoaP [Lachnospiraceae bacterium]|nr:antiterminator LoaP [Lachnospiraceae bacterium]
MDNWYAVQVMTGKEEETCVACKRVIDPQVLNDCFTPKYERMKRYRGAWHKEERPMFPGYIFFVTNQIEEIHFEQKRLPQLTKILGIGAEFIPLSEKEVELLSKIEDERHLIKMSEGYIEGDQIIITSGPMQEMGGTIKKIDRHKRIATIQMEMFGRKMDVVMGLEVVKKI